MPNVTEEQVTGFAHCRDPRCAGYSQQEVPAIRETVNHMYHDSGGDMPGVEKWMVYCRFASTDDVPCPVCKHDREVTEQKRRVYAPLSGHAQDGLLSYKPPSFAS